MLSLVLFLLQQEYILQEIILQLADAGRFQEALDELDLYLPSFPYQDNPVLHFYAGLLSLRLVYSGENGSQHDVDVKVNLLRVAQKHLSKSLVIDPENVVTATFLEETSKQLTSANKSDTQSTADAASDGDMDVDMHRDNNDARPHTKRVRRTPNATQHR
ncbi:hypothetical protein EW145_g133 [Phellinidium pouzarii]|uniref:Uncharacterized protein n=1 Tax=Phellinidium pouzarii TaxID=167371 RepID=A0A4S4LLD5_9AGAM|nr:hypothetical protein EW145_g133 [Phellinidium pouzarii]